ncbi:MULTISPECIES: hypothetical protein [Rhodomicrobium]|uniref:hypothetical protein n=1 Tax=Rhodomicrobium TaxID=1068 RepID=UPI000F748886|nr:MULTISPECIES: hypothetical protein [Rhodomicrobium]
MAIAVRDHLSNTPEHIEEAAKAIGKGHRQAVFRAIYHHKSPIKTVSDIVAVTGLPRTRVLQCGSDLAKRTIVTQTKKGGETAYEMITFFQVNKAKILRLARDPKALNAWPTKRKNLIAAPLPLTVRLPTLGADVRNLTIDEIPNFDRIKSIPVGDSLSKEISEEHFKRGIQNILGDAGQFKDWGGENCDLFSSRLRVDGQRRNAAFAFKGPGQSGRLVPGRMGKNGDQAQRLFTLPAEVFVAQHWREIDPSVIELMRVLAVAKSLSTGKPVWICIIDGQDSERLRKGYPREFSAQI